MKLATRLTVLLIVLTLVMALSVGWYAVSSSTRSAYQTLDNTINSVVDSGIGSPNNALSDAINAVQKNSYDLTLDVVFPSDVVTSLISANVPFDGRPSLAQVRSSQSSVVTDSNFPGFRFRSLNIGGGDFLVVAASTQSIQRSGQRLIERVALAALLAALAMVIIARLFMRRDLVTMEGLITFASDVAQGSTDQIIPENLGSRDVRELRRALATMVESLQEKIEVESRHAESMQLFIGDASHELRTPLTVIKGYTDILGTPEVTPEQLERALARMRTEIERMETLVSDLLLLAELRELPSRGLEVFDLSDVVQRAMDDFRSDNSQRPVVVELRKNVTVSARRDFVARLLANALSNVVRHTTPLAPLKVTLDQEGPWARLIIEDGGDGLPIYGERPERFRRFDQSRARTTGGSGLGMSIMADLSEAMGGTMVTSKSELGGLRLDFEFPHYSA